MRRRWPGRDPGSSRRTQWSSASRTCGTRSGPQLRAVDGIEIEDLSANANRAAGHNLAENEPAALEPTAEWFEGPLEDAW